MKNRLVTIFIIAAAVIAAGCNPLDDPQKSSPDTTQKKTNNKPITTSVVTVEEARQIIEGNSSNPNFILLDVRTKAEYNEGHLKNAQQKDYYASDFNAYLAALDKEKRYLIYCRTQNRSKKAFDILQASGLKYIQYVQGGFTEWANKGYPIEKPQYEKVLDILITADKINVATSLACSFMVTDLDGNPIRKAELSVCVMKSSEKIKEETITADDKGAAAYTFDAEGVTKGSYRLIAAAKKDTYQSACAYYDFTVAEQDQAVQATPQDIDIVSDVTKELVKKFYNRNIYGYDVYNRAGQPVPLASAVKPNKPVLLMFISPTCAGCMVKAQELNGYDLTGITVVPIITSVNDNLSEGIRETETALQGLGLGAIIPQTLYDAKDKIWFSRFKFSTTPKFILINSAGQIKDIIHGSEQLKTANIVQKMEKIFGISPLINRAAIQKQLAEFEKGNALTLKDGQSTLLADITSREQLKDKIAFDYPDYRLELESFSPDPATNTLSVTYHIVCKSAPQYKTKSLTSRLSGFKSTAGSLDEEIAEMKRILEQYRYFDTSEISTILLEDFNQEHIKHDCMQYGYSIKIITIERNTAENSAVLRYYIYKNSKPEVRTEERTQTFWNFAAPSPEAKTLQKVLKRFPKLSRTAFDMRNTHLLHNQSIADTAIRAYFSGEEKKISAIAAGKPILIGIGFSGCWACETSWQRIAQRIKTKPNFTVIELLHRTPLSQESFLANLKGNGVESLKDEFYYYMSFYTSFPQACRPDIKYVPIFMVADKNGNIIAALKDVYAAFDMLEILAQE